MTLRGWSGERRGVPAHPRDRVRRARSPPWTRARRCARETVAAGSWAAWAAPSTAADRRVTGLLPERQLMPVKTGLPRKALGASPRVVHHRRRVARRPVRPHGRETLLGARRHLLGRAGVPASSCAPRACARSPRRGSEAKNPRCGAGAMPPSCRAPASPSAAREVLPEGGAGLRGGSRRRARGCSNPSPCAAGEALSCNSGLLGGEWVIDDFEPIASIPSGRKLTNYQFRRGIGRERRGGRWSRGRRAGRARGVDPGIDTVYALGEIAEAHRRMAAGAATGKLVVVPGRG